MPGGLGLIDYGMVGRLSLPERLKVAHVILALAAGDDALVRFLLHPRDDTFFSPWKSLR